MRVWVTRPASEAQGWVDDLRQRGFDAVALPLIAIVPAPDAAALAAAWSRLASYRAAMFVSGNAVRHFFTARPAGQAWPAGVRAWATGPGTRAALLEAGVPQAAIDSPSPRAAQFDSETLWESVASQLGEADAVLIVRGADSAGGLGRDWLGDQLGSKGARADQVVAYVRTLPSWADSQRGDALAGSTQGCWLFSSSLAVANLCALLPGQSWGRARAVATHARIAQAARAAGFHVVCESRPTVEAVAAALESIR